MKNLIIITAVMFLIASCGKIKQTTTMSGQVVDYGTSEPIENVQIYVRDGFAGSVGILNHDDIGDNEALTYTDENGEFFVEIKAENNPVLYPSKASEYWNYNEGGLVQSGEIFSRGEDNKNIEITLRSLAEMDGIARNINNEKDSFKVKGYLDYPELSSFRRDGFDAEIPFRSKLAIGDIFYTYIIEYKRNGAWNTLVDSVYIGKGERFVDTIYY